MELIADGANVVLHAATGSGKTLSYLLPVLTQLSDDLLSEALGNYLAGFLDGARAARAFAPQGPLL